MSQKNESTLSQNITKSEDNDIAIGYPFVIIESDLIFYYSISVILVGISSLLCLFIVIQILRVKPRRTVFNYQVAFGRSLTILVLIHLFLALQNNDMFCFSTCLLFPIYLIMEKLNNSAMVVTRHCYIFSGKCSSKCSKSGLFGGLWSLVIVCTFALISTFFVEMPPMYAKCRLDPEFLTYKPTFPFLFVYFILYLNSFLLDLFCFIRIFNYMRHNSVRVMVVPSTDQERSKMHNVITAHASFLIWLISCVTFLPVSLLMLKSPNGMSGSYFATLFGYQIITSAVFAVLIPITYIGSSSEFRPDFLRLRTKYMMCGHGNSSQTISEGSINASGRRQDIYAISENLG